jgi:glc operon protein GlcG
MQAKEGEGMRVRDLFLRMPCGILALTLIFASVSLAQTVNEKVLSLQGAKAVAEAAERAAIAHNWHMVIAVLDGGGNLIYLERMDGAPLASIQISRQKAHTAVIFKTPSKTFADGLAKGGTAILKLDALPYAGGIPLTVDGKIVGAIGVSGGSVDAQDNVVAQAGADWLARNSK